MRGRDPEHDGPAPHHHGPPAAGVLIDAGLASRIRRAGGVAAIEPDIEGYAALAGCDGKVWAAWVLPWLGGNRITDPGSTRTVS
jgi:hypothetical protein